MKKFFKKTLVIFVLVLIWQVYSFLNSNFLISSPLEIVQALINLFQEKDIYFHILNSLRRVAVGFLGATILGIGLGLSLGNYKRVGEYFLPLIEILRPIPPIAWIPVAILLFGLGDAPAYFIIFLGAFFPIFSNTYFGAMSLPKIYRNTSQSFELSRFTFFYEILFKYSLPNIFVGLKIGIGMAGICVIAAEMIGAQSGLGYFIQTSRLFLHIDKMLAGIFLIGLIGYFLNTCMFYLEKKIVKWHA
jgi:ABC-type nitrate/sulfonate/bicarbonate transport system permease component